MIRLRQGFGGLSVGFDVVINEKKTDIEVTLVTNRLGELLINVPATGSIPLEATKKLNKLLTMLEIIIEEGGLIIEESAISKKVK